MQTPRPAAGAERSALSALLEPRAVAIVGASEREAAVGAAVYRNLAGSGYAGEVFLVNPRHAQLYGRPCYPDLQALPRPVDLAVIAVPAAAVERVVDDCARARVAAAAVLSGGFAESDDAGRERQARVLRTAREGGVRLLGPNSFGVVRPRLGLNATFAVARPPPGGLALVAQSGALCAALMDWAEGGRVGLSAVVALGAAADIGFGETIDFLTDDPLTRAIVLYVEGVNDARRFVSALRRAACIKPVVAMKAGRHAEGERAISSHTAALLGDDAVFDAALRRCGVPRLHSLAELYAVAGALARLDLPAGRRFVVISNGGGPAALAADAARDYGLAMAELSAEAQRALRRRLPAAAAVANPVDVLGDAGAERFAAALDTVLADPAVDGAAALYVPLRGDDPAEIADVLADAAAHHAKPVVGAWLGDAHVAAAHERCEALGVAHVRQPEEAMAALAALAAFARPHRVAEPAPAAPETPPQPDLSAALAIRQRAIEEERTQLYTHEAHALLAAFGIATPACATASSAEEAVQAARTLGYPVALKLESPDVVHKSDVGGVQLNLADADAVRGAFERLLAISIPRIPEPRIAGVMVQPMLRLAHGRELMAGVATDPAFGRVLCFGAGGVAVQRLHDVAFALPPLDRASTADLIARTRIAALLGAYRNVPAIDADALTGMLLRLSDLVCALPWVRELDINPLLAGAQGCIALDARVVIDPAAPTATGAYPHLAVHPYPHDWVREVVLADGTRCLLRPLLPRDAAPVRALLEAGPERDWLPAGGERLWTCPRAIDYERDMGFVLLRHGADAAPFAVARYALGTTPGAAEFALAVAPDCRRRGAGRALLGVLRDYALARGCARLVGHVDARDAATQQWARRVGAQVMPPADAAARAVRIAFVAG
ncbi:MAG: bifunctional acetate--CoA ligase family protein/GNAT family N-acetyltransferase [Mizugakiibacter sp.]|uniref:bifunctional acetate--CoA ligase family protein/GNAT family N-acetyltransferase n=1 Tax=Mizugakiibacter sp. TaxID=1972610 RepID=UPI0031C80BE3|nr:bifunctional acetate--CoA ligase family protein/GNAT family N-acetyltransferase [Xanthomonadaceae bacterium]